MRAFLAFIDGMNEGIGRIFAWIIVLLMLITVYDVAMRQIFALPTLWAFDVSKQLYALHFLIVGGFGLLHGSHVSVDILHERLAPRTQAVVDVISYLIFFFPFLAMLAWESWDFAARSWASGETTWGVIALPIYPIKTVIVIAAVLLLLQGIAEFARRAAAISDRDGR